MTTVMIIGIVLMVARIVLRIGILLVVIWAGVRLFERFRTPRPRSCREQLLRGRQQRMGR